MLGILLGILYYYIMESDIPRESNCSYLSGIWTDIIAFIYGLVIIYYGSLYDNKILVVCGSTIITEHILQALQHKLRQIRFSNPVWSFDL